MIIWPVTCASRQIFEQAEKEAASEAPHKFEPFWQQLHNKCPPTYIHTNTGAENAPQKKTSLAEFAANEEFTALKPKIIF